MRHDRTSTDNYIITDSGITENDTVCSDKDIVPYPNNSYLGMCSYFYGTRVMHKNSHIA